MVSLKYYRVDSLMEGGWNIGWFRDSSSNSVFMCICDYVVYLQGVDKGVILPQKK